MALFPASVRRLLRVPLFHKVFLANVAIVTGAVALTAWLTRTYFQPEPEVATPLIWLAFGVGVILASLGANALLIRLALSPLKDLEDTARRVGAGDPAQRALVSPLADRDLERTIRSFNEMLDRLASYRSRLRDLSLGSLLAQEEERKRIARELHDDPAQRIVAGALRLAVVRKQVEEPELGEELDRIHKDLVEAVEGLRRIARGLRPPALDELGLFAAVETHAREVRDRFGLRVSVEGHGLDRTLGPEAELAAYRIVQEALSNVRRHAEATRVDVRFQEGEEGYVRITVEDDGRGFVPEEALNRKGETLGLFGMMERGSYVNGEVEIVSEPGKGTRVDLRLPASSPDRLPGR